MTRGMWIGALVGTIVSLALCVPLALSFPATAPFAGLIALPIECLAIWLGAEFIR